MIRGAKKEVERDKEGKEKLRSERGKTTAVRMN